MSTMTKPAPIRLQDHRVPSMPTATKVRYGDGRILPVGGGLWLYRKAPMAPARDAKSHSRALEVGDPIAAAFEEIAAETQYTTARRSIARSRYRPFHLLLINLPRRYSPPGDSRIPQTMQNWFGHERVQDRVLLMGTKLNDTLGGSDRSLRDAFDSVATSLATADVPMADYQADLEDVDGMLTRSGFTIPTAKDFHLAESWWAAGGSADATILPHADHLHVFRTVAGVQTAARLDVNSCADWPTGIEGHHVLRMGSVHGLDLPFSAAKNPLSAWATSLLDKGAVMVSIRGKVEPSPITRKELRRQRERYLRDIHTARAEGRMDDQQQEEMLATLESVEGAYSSGKAFPTLVETSVVATFTGHGRKRLDSLGNGAAFEVASMDNRQELALAESWIGSPARANPNLMDLPSSTVAYSGLPSLSTVGDARGINVGFTVHDRQEALMSATKSSDQDIYPIGAIVGSSGGGKMVGLSTTIPTPDGYTKMGDIEPGHEVIGRDGQPVRVAAKSPVKAKPDLYRVTLSDGQSVLADYDHQWVVSDYHDRHAHKTAQRRNAVEAWKGAHAAADAVARAACTYPDNHVSSAVELATIMRQVPDTGIEHKGNVVASLAMMNMEPNLETRTIARENSKKSVTTRAPSVTFDTREAMSAAVAGWREGRANLTGRWADRVREHVRVATALLERDELPQRASEADLIEMLVAAGDRHRLPQGRLSKHVRKHGATSERVYFTQKVPQATSSQREIRVWPTGRALAALAERIRQKNAVRPRTEVSEHRMTTGEMIAEGLHLENTHGGKKFAIRVPDAIDLPRTALPVGPYTLGAWLGDGSTGSAQITGIDPGIWEGIEQDGYMVSHHAQEKSHYIRGLAKHLRKAGFIVKSGAADKHIPIRYLRASYHQRLALLQGLLDTDGTIGRSGGIGLALTNERLATDALELARTLGIKASMTEGPAAYTLTDPGTGEKTRKVTGTRYRVKFTTDQPVFRLTRKKALLPTRLRETSQWLYVESIEQVAPEPAACITVDSEDRTYLVGRGMVPTSNTQYLAYSAFQYSLEGRPVIVIDPKKGSDLSAAFGDKCTTFSLDEFAGASGGLSGSGGTGVCDPLRFSKTPADGINTAVSVLHDVNVWPHGSRQNFEADLQAALKYGVSKGAKAIGTALEIAKRDGEASKELADPILRQSGNDPMFGAIVGLRDEGEVLSAAESITYIKVGNANLELPPMGVDQNSLGLTQRISAALIRMLVFGSAEALRDRRGVLMLDEAWVFLGAGAEEMERLGRLARSLEVFPILFTQRISDLLEANLTNHISRGIILHTKDPKEAEAAFRLFGVEPTQERMDFTTAPERIGKGGANWKSRKPLFTYDDRDNRTSLLRGAVGLYCDLDDRAVDVEIKIPPDFLAKASTNALDRAKREGRQVI
ncbi:MAG: ATP-binding protein [Nocardioides sp.]|nr:ATP-binding protein [Nocardioides sp.]